jgi:TolA-binding protein
MRSLRAGTQTRSEELVGRIEQLEARLEDQSQQLNDLAGRRARAAPCSTSAGVPVAGAARAGHEVVPRLPSASRSIPTAAYDQPVLDFTQGRFPLALTEFRAFVQQHGATDLGDNAQYGVGRVVLRRRPVRLGRRSPTATSSSAGLQGDKVPAALYKLGIAYQKGNKSAEARTTYNTLIEKYPRSGEARLAAERVKEMDPALSGRDWAANARAWVRWVERDPHRAGFLDRALQDVLGARLRGTRWLDAGCGEGRVARALARRGAAVLGRRRPPRPWSRRHAVRRVRCPRPRAPG